LAANALFCSGVLNSPMNEAHFTKALCSKLYALFDEEDFTHNSLSSLLCISRVPQKRCRCPHPPVCAVVIAQSNHLLPLASQGLWRDVPSIKTNCPRKSRRIACRLGTVPRDLATWRSLDSPRLRSIVESYNASPKEFTVSLHISKQSSNGSKSHFTACL
jgi:hypothetical protein